MSTCNKPHMSSLYATFDKSPNLYAPRFRKMGERDRAGSASPKRHGEGRTPLSASYLFVLSVWKQTCDHVTTPKEFPFRCCEANIGLPADNVRVRYFYTQLNPSKNSQCCGTNPDPPTAGGIGYSR